MEGNYILEKLKVSKKMKFCKTILISIIFLASSCSKVDDNFIEESGTIETKGIMLSSQVFGKIKTMINDEGSEISGGDTILVIDKELYEIQLLQAKAAENLAQAQYNFLLNGARKEDRMQVEELLNQAETNFNSASMDLDRFHTLYNTQSITKKQLEDIESRFKITEAQYNSAKANMEKINNIARPEELQQAKANLERTQAATELIRKNLRDCIVISPIDGIVTKCFFEEGETVSPMSSLVKISNLSLVEMNVYVNETNLGKGKINQSVEVKIDSFPEKTYKGKVVYTSPEAEFTPKTIQTKDERTKLVYKVKLQIQNQNNELKSGMPADAKILLH